MNFITDPRIFSYAVMILYILNAARWAYERKFADVAYWILLCLLQAVVTFGYKH